jgi:mono/diheme cytochrome c family protein
MEQCFRSIKDGTRPFGSCMRPSGVGTLVYCFELQSQSMAPFIGMNAVRVLPRAILLTLFSVALLHANSATVLAQENVVEQKAEIDFVRDVRPIFVQRCYQCHSAKKIESGFRLDVRRMAFAGGDQGIAIVPNQPAKSDLLTRITSSDEDKMPPKGKPLSADQIAVLKKWIAGGAEWPANVDAEDVRYSKHWSWQPLSNPALPPLKNPTWPENEIDSFILKRLEDNSILPAPVADRHTLIRRVYLDTIGLPPTTEEWQRWMQNDSPDWYVQLVDQLLASPHFGERWGRIWLDQARYADSDGYEKDRPRPQAYLFRDWVFNAINADLPFDEFSIQQLAGDLIPNATPTTKSATGFHRNTLTNNEGGIDREEDRVKQTVDRLNTTFTVWMGLTVQCAQCHSHKYDPISHREYYQLYSFFNDADESQVKLLPSIIQQRQHKLSLDTHENSLADKKQKLTAARTRLTRDLSKLVADLKKRFPDGQPTAPTDGLVGHYPFNGPKETALANTAPLMKADRAISEKREPAKFHGPGELKLTKRLDEDGAIEFNGSGQHLELPGLPAIPADQSFTCSAWIKATDSLGAIITKLDEPNDFHGIDFTNNRGLLEVHLVEKWPVNGIKVTPKTARLVKDKWQHIVFTYDGSRKAAGVNLFIDGVKVESQIHNDNLTGDFTTEDPWRIGRRKSGTFLKGTIDEARIYNRALTDAEVALIAGDFESIGQALELANISSARRTPAQSEQLFNYFASADNETSQLAKEIQNLESAPPQVARNSAMSLNQRAQPRETHIHIRGEFLDKGPRVEVNTPTFLPKISSRGARLDRLDLANWIFSPDNSLTPRVYVNRVWQEYFGRALVVTENDFGTQGEEPTHPKLLDWLSNELRESGWKPKSLHRKILLSSTYKQSSNARPELADVDPENSLLSHQNRLRVSAESVRDLALSASGLLDRRVNGPSVYPPLPPGVIELAFVDVINRGPWKTSTGGDRFRRGVYTFFQRTSPYPMLTLFDAPDSNVTCTRREKSNTPLQALTMWNDAVIMECAQQMVLRVFREVDGEANRMERAFVLCVSRRPDDRERKVMAELLQRSRTVYEKDEKLLANAVGKTAPPVGIEKAEFAAWISLTRALLNIDEFITRP